MAICDSFVRSVSGDNFVFCFSTISWLRLKQETMWVNINFERRDLTHFAFMFLTKNFFSVPLKNLNLNYYCQVLQVSPHRINDGLPGCSSVPRPASASPPPWYAAQPNSHIQKQIIWGCFGIEILFSFQVFTRNIKK